MCHTGRELPHGQGAPTGCRRSAVVLTLGALREEVLQDEAAPLQRHGVNSFTTTILGALAIARVLVAPVLDDENIIAPAMTNPLLERVSGFSEVRALLGSTHDDEDLAVGKLPRLEPEVRTADWEGGRHVDHLGNEGVRRRLSVNGSGETERDHQTTVAKAKLRVWRLLQRWSLLRQVALGLAGGHV